MVSGFSPEQQIVVGSIRQAFGRGRLPSAKGPVNWKAALSFATRQGVAPVVYAGLSQLGVLLPASIRTNLQAQHLLSMTRLENHLEPTLRRVIETLGARGLEPIVLKGAALAYLAYPSPAQRTLADIDLLLPEGEAERASEALLEVGFWKDAAFRRVTNELPAHYSSEGQLAVDIHRRLLKDSHTYAVDEHEMSARSARASLGGVDARVLAGPDMLLHICIHLAASDHYRLFALRGLTDILAITTGWKEGLEWDVFVDTVKRSGTSGAVYWPLRFSRAWLDSAVPESVLSELAPPRAVRKLVVTITRPQSLLELPAGGDRGNETEQGADTLYEMRVAFSLHAGYSTRQLARELGRAIFPPQRRTASAAEYPRSAFKHTVDLLAPARAARGLAALVRLLTRTRPRNQSQ